MVLNWLIWVYTVVYMFRCSPEYKDSQKDINSIIIISHLVVVFFYILYYSTSKMKHVQMKLYCELGKYIET